MIRAYKLSKDRYQAFEDKNVIWDSCLAQIRLFQAAVFECIEQTVLATVLGRVRNMMLGKYVSFILYITQYLDILNERFLGLDEEKRVKSISIMVKRIVEQDDEYQQCRAEVRKAAQMYECSTQDIGLDVEYPEEIDW